MRLESHVLGRLKWEDSLKALKRSARAIQRLLTIKQQTKQNKPLTINSLNISETGLTSGTERINTKPCCLVDTCSSC